MSRDPWDSQRRFPASPQFLSFEVRSRRPRGSATRYGLCPVGGRDGRLILGHSVAWLPAWLVDELHVREDPLLVAEDLCPLAVSSPQVVGGGQQFEVKPLVGQEDSLLS